MAVEGVGNLVQNLANHLFQPGEATPTVAPVVGARNVGIESATEDTFTPSAQNNSPGDAQAEGIFQPNPGTVTAATVGASLAPSYAPPNAPPNAPQSQAAVANPNAAQSNTTGTTGSVANSGQAASNPAATAELQLEIQRLNASLPALGLTNSQIQQIDRIASLIGDFNPAAYANLVNQFESQSQNTAPAAPPASPRSVTFGSAQSAGVETNATDSGFQVREILTTAANSQSGAQPNPSNGVPQSSSSNPAAFHPHDL